MLVSVSEASKALGLSAEHIRRQIRLGRWPVYKLGPKATRLDLQEIKSLGRLVFEIEQEKKGLSNG
jgi:excisionase family DNA binding protein